MLGPAALSTLAGGGPDPADRARAAHTTALLLVEGARATADREVADRVLHLADEHGLELLADLWSDSPPDSLPGALWRLYALRSWVHADPAGAAHQFTEGRLRAPVLEVVAGVADPPGPDQVRDMLDAVLTGVSSGDLAVTLERAAAFARIVAVGRVEQAYEPVDVGSQTRTAGPARRSGEALRDEATEDAASRLTQSAGRLLRTAEQLEVAAQRWRSGQLT